RRDSQGGCQPHRDRDREAHAQVARLRRPQAPDRGGARRGRLQRVRTGGQRKELMEELAQVYARSLFEVAKEHGVLDELHDQLGIWSDALSETRELQVFFFSPRFSSAEKKDAIRKIIDGGDERF